MAAIAIFLNERPKKIKIAARGRAISRAVDVAEILRSRYLNNFVKIDEIDIYTERIKTDEKKRGKGDRVSNIIITLRNVSKTTILPKRKTEK